MKIVSTKAVFLMLGSLMLSACGPSSGNGAEHPEADAAAEVETNTPDAVVGSKESSRVSVVFPENFRGNWDYNENGCGEGESGTKFRITDKEIIGYEDTSILKSVQVVDDLTIRVVLENESSEGNMTLRQTMHLSPVAGISMRIEQGGETIRTLRCDPV